MCLHFFNESAFRPTNPLTGTETFKNRPLDWFKSLSNRIPGKNIHTCGQTFSFDFVFLPVGEYSWESLVGVCRPVLQILTLFHTRFQTRSLKSIPILRPGFWAEIMSSLLRFERKQKHFEFAYRKILNISPSLYKPLKPVTQ